MPSLEPDDHDLKAPSHGERSAETAARLAWMMSGNREGNAAVFDGHGHSPESVAALAEPVIGPGSYEVHEVWMHYTPRIKWCQRVDGYGCDNDGEWHGHWFETKRNPFHPESGALSVAYPPGSAGDAK